MTILETSELLSKQLETPDVSDEDYIKMVVDRENQSQGDLNSLDGFNCKICNNRGYSMKAVRDESGAWHETMVKCKCLKARKMIALLKKSGLQSKIKNCKFETFKATEDWQKKMLTVATAYAKNPKDWLFFGGQPGAGKTHICTAVARELLLRNIEVYYMLWRDGITEIKSNFRDTSSCDYVNKLKTVECLYIDDLFKAPAGKTVTDWEIEQGFEILNARYNKPELLTIISSEKTLKEIVMLDEATGSRIAERSRENCFSIGKDVSKNYRLKGMI